MDESFIRNRITQLRIQKGASEYQMSYDLGHSRAYVNNISAGKSLPSVGELLAVCDYFGISPKDFFDEKLENPAALQAAIDAMQGLCEEDLHMVQSIILRLQKR